MNPRLRALLLAGSSGGGAFAGSGAGYNMGPIDQTSGYWPYINVVKNGFSDWSSGTATYDSNDNILTLPIGESIHTNVWNLLVPGIHYIKPGQYVIKWDGPTVDVSVTVQGSSGFSQVGRRAVITVPQVGENAGNKMLLQWTNTTGSTAFALSNLRVCHIDHEAALDAGEIFNPDWIAALGNNVAHIRVMKAMQIETSVATSASQLRPESSRCWTTYDPTDPTALLGMPYTVAAKLAVKLNCNLHVCFPVRGDQACYNAIAAELASVSSFFNSNLLVEAEFGNEIWNFGYGHRTWLQSVYGPTQSPVLSAPEAEAQKALMVFKALALHFPRDRVKRLFCSQFGSVADGSYSQIALNYVDTANLCGTGGTSVFKNLIDEIRVAPYTHCAIGSTELYHHNLTNVDWVNQTDSQMDTMFAAGQTIAEARLAAFLTSVATEAPSLTLGSYEWGQEMSKVVSGFAGQGYEFTINPTHNTAVWTADYPANFTDGDLWQFFHDQTTPAYPISGYVYGTQYFIKAKNSSEAWFFASDAARLADTGNTGAGAIVLDSTPTSTVFWADNWTRAQQFGARMKSYLDSAAGAAMYQRWYEATIGTGKLSLPTQLYDFCGYSDQGFVASWGLKRGVYAPNTPRYLFYKGLATT